MTQNLAFQFDSTAVVWKPTTVRTTAGARQQREAYARGSVVELVIVASAQTIRPIGPGERDTAQRKGLASASADIPARSVLEITGGRERGTLWMVTSSRKPRGRLTELEVEPFAGELANVP